MKLAVRINVDGSTVVMDISGDDLKALQSAVGGYVEAVSLKDKGDMWVNEEGKLRGFTVNRIATNLFLDVYNLIDYVVGDVVITAKSDEYGEIKSLRDEEVAGILEYVGRVSSELDNHRI